MDAPASHRIAATIGATTPVYVYQWPVRFWHWVTTAAIVLLAATGWLIAHPITGLGTGMVRLLHLVAGVLLGVGFLGRIYWAFVGNHHSRTIFFLPVWRREFWKEIGEEMAWYGFRRKVPKRWVGHNPLARAAMFGLFMLGTVLMIATGFALWGEDVPGGLVQRSFGWVFWILGPSSVVRAVHHLGMWILLCFSTVHIYFVIREDIMGRTSTVSAMIGGWRTFKDAGGDDLEDD